MDQRFEAQSGTDRRAALCGADTGRLRHALPGDALEVSRPRACPRGSRSGTGWRIAALDRLRAVKIQAGDDPRLLGLIRRGKDAVRAVADLTA